MFCSDHFKIPIPTLNLISKSNRNTMINPNPNPKRLLWSLKQISSHNFMYSDCIWKKIPCLFKLNNYSWRNNFFSLLILPVSDAIVCYAILSASDAFAYAIVSGAMQNPSSGHVHDCTCMCAHKRACMHWTYVYAAWIFTYLMIAANTQQLKISHVIHDMH